MLAGHLRGDTAAFRQLVERHHREMFRFIVRFTGSAAAAEDVVQEAFLQVHVAAARFDRDRKLKPWLFTIAANKARDYLRSRSRRKELPLDAPIPGKDDADAQRFFAMMAEQGPTPAENVEREERSRLVREVVHAMPATLREVLLLAYFHGFPYKDMAEILDIPLGTVKSRLHSAVASFGKLFRARLNPERGRDV